MKEILKTVFVIMAVEAVHFLLLTGGLCLLGFFTRANGETAFTYTELLWTGTVSFWFDGYGPILLLCLACVVGSSFWDTYVSWLALDNRRKTLDAEVERRADGKVAELRPTLETDIDKAYQEKYAARQHALAEKSNRLATQRYELEEAKHAMERERVCLRADQNKVAAWKSEVEALRQKAAKEKEKKASVRQHIQWAVDTLAEETPNLGLALRHLKKAKKL